MNPDGAVAGIHQNSGGAAHGFVRSAKGKIKTFDVDGATGTFPQTINAKDVIAGAYYDADSVRRGFVGKP